MSQLNYCTDKQTLQACIKAYNILDQLAKGAQVTKQDDALFTSAKNSLADIFSNNEEYDRYYVPGKGFRLTKKKPIKK